MAIESHIWNDEFCSCGQDSVTCQCCGQRVCGTMSHQVENVGNVCWICRQHHTDEMLLRIREFRRSGYEVTR